jgi:outer membrane immunogenic protein
MGSHSGVAVKKIFVGGIFASVFASAPVLAADMPVKAPVYKASAPSFSWTGCYIGAVAGYGWGSSDQSFVGGGPAIRGADVNGGTAGGTLGCNFQNGLGVWGIENDFSWAGFKGDDPDIQIPSFRIGTKTTWLDTLRLRLGYAADRTLWYVTGGVAFANVKATEVEPGVNPESEVSKTHTGWTLGGGAEYAFDPNWSAKLEYLHVDFNGTGYSGFCCGYSAKGSVNLKEEVVRVGINYRFGSR